MSSDNEEDAGPSQVGKKKKGKSINDVDRGEEFEE